MNIEFIGKKARSLDSPYAVFTGTMFGGPAIYKVLKKYRNDDAGEYAAWMVAAETPATFGGYDMGDIYVAEVVKYLDLTEVDGRPPTGDELRAINELKMELENLSVTDWFV